MPSVAQAIEYKPPVLPAAMFDCPDAPTVPDKGADDADVADFIYQLWQARESCGATVSGLQAYLGRLGMTQNVPVAPVAKPYAPPAIAHATASP